MAHFLGEFSKQKYTLDKIIQVEGRQGIATNTTHYFVSSSTALYTYDLEGNLLMQNDDPFVDLPPPINHFGDIGYYDGELYTGVEYFESGRSQNIQIALYDAETLNYTRSWLWDAASGQVDCGAVGIDTDNSLIWMTDWVNSNYIYKYDLQTGDYVGKLHLRATPLWTQGISAYKGDLYVTADDGDVDRNEPDDLWLIPGDTLEDNSTLIQHELAFTAPPLIMMGEIEGLDFNRATNQMIVLSNRGMQIVLGVPTGYYPGYTEEIHDLYVFNITADESIDVDVMDEPETVHAHTHDDPTTSSVSSTNEPSSAWMASNTVAFVLAGLGCFFVM